MSIDGDNAQNDSVQFKRFEKSLCALTRLLDVFPVLKIKRKKRGGKKGRRIIIQMNK